MGTAALILQTAHTPQPLGPTRAPASAPVHAGRCGWGQKRAREESRSAEAAPHSVNNGLPGPDGTR